MGNEKELSDGEYIAITVCTTMALLVLGLLLNNTTIIELGLCGSMLAIPYTIGTAMKAILNVVREHKRRN